MFTLACSLVSNGLFGKIHLHFHFRVSIDRVEQFLKKSFCNDYRKHEVIQLVILVNICKETRDYHPETITRNSPSSMLAARTGTEVLPCHQYLSPISRIVQHKFFIQ